ncbi:hypothetical protein SUGI_0503560 [Cryptomeria japonica]|nr:hypothetical protein SUGI_0503560 [Cryptomeria japonica]
MAKAAPKALCHVWRCFQRSSYDACKFRAASPLLGTLPYQCIHRRYLVEARQSPQVRPWVFNGQLLQEQLHKNLKKNDERMRLEQISPPELQKITVEDMRRLARLDRLEAFKRRLEQIPHELISYRELLRVCMVSAERSSEEEADAFVKILDESGHILVLGSTVHLRPHKVVRALEMVMELSVSPEADRRSLELANLEDQKKKIDEEAEKRAKAELWWGLGFFTVKTALLMRICIFPWDFNCSYI